MSLWRRHSEFANKWPGSSELHSTIYDVIIPHIISEEDLTYLKETCGKLWLESAKSARKGGNIQVSYSALLHAEEFMERSSAIENRLRQISSAAGRLVVLNPDMNHIQDRVIALFYVNCGSSTVLFAGHVILAETSQDLSRWK
ncbi:MAG: hypothetical protein J3Q66DRAFT_399270 [Benniella sp.]|nr:MAG: hypothetical protein J3Q66DRAFT_399270 [Benniella sp.]